MNPDDLNAINEQDRSASLASFIKLIPHLVLLTALAVSCFVWMQTKKHFDIVAKERFASQVALTKSKIEGRMLDYEQVLRSGVAFHDSSNEVSRGEWQQFLASCETQTWFPGIQGIGVSVPVAKQDIVTFEKLIQQEGFPDFQISPPGDRNDYTAVKFIEPFNWRNRKAFGYDMYSDPIRREAMERAATTGLPSLSGKITLIQETEDDFQFGVICYLPLYEKEASLQTADERKEALLGWVYAAFRCNDLMAGILGEYAKDVNLEIYDTETATAEHILFDSQPVKSLAKSSEKLLSTVVPINLSGRTWTMRLEAQPTLFIQTESLISPIVGAIGILTSILLYVLLLSFTRQRELAIELARRMTLGLVESEQKTRSILENASEAILSVSETAEISAANRAAHKALAVSSTLVATSMDDFLVDTNFDELVKRSQEVDGSILVTCRKANGEKFNCSVSIGEVSLDNKLHYIMVAKDETSRIAAAEKLAEKNNQLVLASRNAGMAEVATGVLHNVGNVLNSVNVSTTILDETMKSSSVSMLKKGVDLLEQHKSGIVEFLTEHERGKHFPEFIQQITKALLSERETGLSEIKSLVKSVEHIRGIVAAQQSSASCSRIAEPIQIALLIESAIKMNEASMSRHDVQLITQVPELPTVVSEQHSILQILINLIKNAKEACGDLESSLVTVTAIEESCFVRVDVKDNGVGISPEQLKSLFQHGFTTKPNGHGFGLHAAAITATELGGSLSVHSDGLGKGAVFTLRIPLNQDKALAKTTNPNILVVDDLKDSGCQDILQAN